MQTKDLTSACSGVPLSLQEIQTRLGDLSSVSRKNEQQGAATFQNTEALLQLLALLEGPTEVELDLSTRLAQALAGFNERLVSIEGVLAQLVSNLDQTNPNSELRSEISQMNGQVAEAMSRQAAELARTNGILLELFSPADLGT